MNRTVDRSKWTNSGEFEKYARLGLSYTKMMLSRGPANQGIRPVEFIETFLARFSYGSGATCIAEQESVYNAALKMKTGNCTEHAAVAFIYLHRLGFRPLTVFGYPGLGGGHMMCAVGLDLEAANFTLNCGKEKLAEDRSWICDPWKNVCYQGRNFTEREPADQLQVHAVSI